MTKFKLNDSVVQNSVFLELPSGKELYLKEIEDGDTGNSKLEIISMMTDHDRITADKQRSVNMVSLTLDFHVDLD